jgi:hypothetical protein
VSSYQITTAIPDELAARYHADVPEEELSVRVESLPPADMRKFPTK